MNEVIKKIINYAIWAPSGDNTQPWRFEINKNEIRVFIVPERDTSLYNYNQNASLVAIGGLIENIKIAAPHYGYVVSINFFPEGITSNLVATILLNEGAQQDDPLYLYIKERVTNRKPYETRPLSNEHKQYILEIGDTVDNISVKLVDEPGNIESLANAASVNEKVVLENKQLHNFLFSHITWSEEEDEKKKGFFVKTLELKGPQVVAFKLFRHWPILKLFNKIGASDLVARDNAKIYKQSGAFVAIIANDTSPFSFLKSGMLMQKLWLRATKLGLGVQPLTGVLFLHHRISAGNNGGLLNHHIDLVEKAYFIIEKIFETNNRPIIMMFRIGYADKPSARCSRKDPAIKFSS
jgi:nitroreductase